MGILVNLHYIPVYSQPYFQQFGYIPENYPESQKYYATAISLPMYYSLSEQEQDFVVDMINKPFGFQNLF